MPEMDMRRMQEEAARRAREMQARARQQSTQGQQRFHPPAPARQDSRAPSRPQEPPPPPPAAPEPAPLPAAPASPPAQPAPSLLDELFKDRERTVLLALLILLGNEEGSTELLFALLFLLM